MMNTLSLYGSHDAGAVFVDYTGKLKILEYERFVQKRYAMYSDMFDSREKDLGTNQKSREMFIDYIVSQIANPNNLNIVYAGLSETDIEYLKLRFPNSTFKMCGHHISHAASGFFTSNYDEAIIFSVDGGGVDNGMVAFTKVFKGSGKNIELLETPDINLGVAYGRIGCPISEIKPGPDSNLDSLVYAGKVMGLCAYGNVREDWVEAVEEYYSHYDLNILGNAIGLNLEFNKLEGQNSYDLAATSQHVFESILWRVISKYVEENNNFILVGGCALNVLFNQRLKAYFNTVNKNLYVPSNPNDCGLALGQYLLDNPDSKPSVYSGFDILDRDEKLDRINRDIKTSQVVDMLKQGKILGMVEGNSEVGPRALGNRSIICDPSFENMKDILNSKVKFREWFRPFAPVCRLEDKDKYFDLVYESEYMSYAPFLKEEFHDKLKSICHADGTARLQTVTREQHKTFYDILTELDNRGEIPVILNTSFNIKGKPILTTIKDALYCLDNTEMDNVIVEGKLYERK